MQHNPHVSHFLNLCDEPIDPIDELQQAYQRLEQIAGEKETRRFVASIAKYGNCGPEVRTRMINAKIADLELDNLPY